MQDACLGLRAEASAVPTGWLVPTEWSGVGYLLHTQVPPLTSAWSREMGLEIGLLITKCPSLIRRVLEISPQAFRPSRHPLSLTLAPIALQVKVTELCLRPWY